MKRSKAAPLFLLLAYSIFLSACADEDLQPTAIIVDNETGKPIEGAVALAQWLGHSWTERAWWEGGRDMLDEAKETFSDKEGKIYIKGFWDKSIFSKKPRLTVYKASYTV